MLNEATPTRKNAVIRFLSDFFSWLKSKFTGSKQIISEIADLENMFRELIGDAAVNPMLTESGITYDTAETEANESMSVAKSTTDSTGKLLSKDQQKFFARSKAKDRYGRLMRLYHGSSQGGFTVFDPKKSDDALSLFFTDTIEMAESYSGSRKSIRTPSPKPNILRWLDGGTKKAGNQQGVYEVYANITNPMIIEAKGRNFNQLSINAPNTKDVNLKVAGYENDMRIEITIGKENYVEYFYNFDEAMNFVARKLDKGERSRLKAAFFKGGFINIDTDFKWDTERNQRVPYLNIRDVAKTAKKQGHDGVIVRDVTDYDNRYGTPEKTPPGTVVVAFKSNQIKDVHNTNPTKSKDIRYSVPASEGAVNEKTTEEVGGTEIIDLSNDSDLSKIVKGLHGNPRYTAIKNYILEKLSDQPIVLSDGKQAVVDRNDAQHIASRSGDEKAAQISQIKQIVETAKLIAEETSTKDGKFDYFYYYQANVRYGGETYPIYLNVGRARNDGTYHIYDITKKLRDTAHRVNDVGRPVGNALKNGISNNKIPESLQNVKEKSSNQNEIKQKQLEIIKKTNPMWDDYHTGIRTVDDIRTWEEVLELNDESEGQFVWGDFSREEAEQALKDGTITVYSSYPIENGVFVSTSYIQAEEYAGGRGGKVYSKTIPITNVAWINGDEGQYAKVNNDLTFSVPASEGEAVTSKSLFEKVQKGEISYEEFVKLVDEGWIEAGKTYGIKPDGEMVTENNKE